ncbi:unnamed protein product, partial [Ascophyllum nodosum]
PQKRKNLTTDGRSAALQDLLARSNNGVLRRGAVGEVGEKYGNSRRAMLNLWKRYAEQKSAGVAVPDVSCRRRGSARDLTQQKEALQSMPLKQRTTQRSVAAAIDLPKTTFRRRMKDLGVKSHTRFFKPLLSNAHKLKRLRWARSFAGTTTGGIRRFKGMGNVLRAAMSSDGWDIRMINQPANSPDTNVLDLGFFRSVQSLQDRTTPRNIGDLVKAVKDAWNDDPPDVLNRVWLSLQACLEQIMLAGGDNDYKISHLRKGRLQDAGTLPWSLECSEEAWVKGAAALAE